MQQTCKNFFYNHFRFFACALKVTSKNTVVCSQKKYTADRMRRKIKTYKKNINTRLICPEMATVQLKFCQRSINTHCVNHLKVTNNPCHYYNFNRPVLTPRNNYLMLYAQSFVKVIPGQSKSHPIKSKHLTG